MKSTLNSLMKETAVNEMSEKSTLSLILAVLLKYGMAPLACIYLAYVNLHKDEAIERQSSKLTVLVEAQTAATVKNTEVQGYLIKVVEANTRKLEEIERKK